MYCTSNLKQLGLALHSYHDARQRFPSGVITSGDDFRDGMHSGFTLLLPHLEESSLHRAYDFASNWRSENNLSVAQNRLDVLLCPSSGNVVPQDGGAAGAPANYAFCKGSVAFLCSQPAGGGMEEYLILMAGSESRRSAMVRHTHSRWAKRPAVPTC